MTAPTAQTGVPISLCDVCGTTHPVTRTHCAVCGRASLFGHDTHADAEPPAVLADLSVEEIAARILPTVGSLCSGVGGLDMAVEAFFGARTAWFSEFDAAPSKVLAHHWPDVPNLGDMTKIKWTPDCPECAEPLALYNVGADAHKAYWCPVHGEFDLSIRDVDPDAHRIPSPVDIVTGGTPCQDLSAAGRRKGMTEGTRSNLWVQMRECIAAVRPSIVIWENVRGAYSARATSEVELEQGLLGESYGPARPALRALGRVLGDLSDLGFDAEVVGLRAADAGAPHGRFRVFVVAYAQGDARWLEFGDRRAAAESEYVGGHGTGRAWHGRAKSADGDRRADLTLLPTPAAANPLRVASSEASLTGGPGPVAASASVWGPYTEAIRRWELILGRPAPSPTLPDGKDGRHRLNARLVEFMMGLPEGWVTAPELGLTRNEQLKALGNGVVPQQAQLALSIAWPRITELVAA